MMIAPRYSPLIRPEDGAFRAEVPDLEGRITWSETVDAALANAEL